MTGIIMSKIHYSIRCVLVLAFMALFAGCAAPDEILTKDEEAVPAKLMEEGLYNLEKGYYTGASEAFQKLVDRYPYSKYSVEAELKLSDALYYKGSYDEAFDSYNEFQRLHPKNKNIPYVLYQKGMCNFSQVSTIDRDQVHTLKAAEEFERLTKQYPESEYAGTAHWKMRECYMLLAEAELYVAHFYYKRRYYQAAMNRYRYILKNYPDLGQYHEALEYLGKCKEKIAEGAERPWYY